MRVPYRNTDRRGDQGDSAILGLHLGSLARLQWHSCRDILVSGRRMCEGEGEEIQDMKGAEIESMKHFLSFKQSYEVVDTV